jgi:hypothetical protein
MASYQPPSHHARQSPPILSLPCPHSNTPIEFKICEHFTSRVISQQLYITETTDSKKIIVVKFAYHYSYELPAFCAVRGQASSILGFKSLPGGFFGITIELLTLAWETLSSRFVEKYGEWANQLRQLVDVFHAEGLVHGDLWSPNILCNGDRLMLLNFDWEKRKGRCFAWMSSLTQS